MHVDTAQGAVIDEKRRLYRLYGSITPFEIVARGLSAVEVGGVDGDVAVLVEQFRAAEWDAEKADKDLDSGIAEVRSRLESERSDARDRPGSADGSPTPGLLISDQCENLIRELLSYQEEHVGKSGAEDHCCDALRYAVHTEARDDSDSGGPTVPIRSYRARKSSSPARKPHF